MDSIMYYPQNTSLPSDVRKVFTGVTLILWISLISFSVSGEIIRGNQQEHVTPPPSPTANSGTAVLEMSDAASNMEGIAEGETKPVEDGESDIHSSANCGGTEQSHLSSSTDKESAANTDLQWPHWKAHGHVLNNPDDSKHVFEPFSFVVIADPQLGFHGIEEEKANLRSAIADVNKMQPAFVALVGDLAQAFPKPDSQDKRKAEIEEFSIIMKLMDPKIPVLVTCGNHDVNDIPTPEDIMGFESDYGDAYYSFETKGILVIVLNSSLLSNPSKTEILAKEQLDWIERTLRGAKEKKYQHIMVFSHIPFFYERWDEENDNAEIKIIKLNKVAKVNHFRIPQERRMRLLKLFVDCGVNYTFHGHTHYNSVIHSGSINQVVTSAVGFPVMDDVPGYRVVKVSEDSVTHEFIPVTKPRS